MGVRSFCVRYLTQMLWSRAKSDRREPGLLAVPDPLIDSAGVSQVPFDPVPDGPLDPERLPDLVEHLPHLLRRHQRAHRFAHELGGP
jgi:hypothetical protein